jgi:hypothetical protein
VALSHSTGPKKVFLATQMLNQMLGLGEQEITAAINTPEGLSAVVPAANIYSSAKKFVVFIKCC